MSLWDLSWRWVRITSQNFGNISNFVFLFQGQIEGRIDSHNKILFAKKTDQRSLTFERSLKIGDEYERRTKLMILRAAMLKAQIVVKVGGEWIGKKLGC